MGLRNWAAVGATAAALWLVVPMAHAWVAGAVLPQDSSATCYSCRLASELGAVALQDRFPNAHRVFGIPSMDKCSPRHFIEDDVAAALAGIDAVKHWRIERMREEERNLILRESFSKGQLALWTRCIQDSSLSIACKARVSNVVDAAKRDPRWLESARSRETEERRVVQEAEARCEKVLERGEG